jgi:hypothetical protein
MNLVIEIEQEEDGRWIAEVPNLPGVMTYGESREEAIARVQALTLRVLAERPAWRSSSGSPQRNLPGRVTAWPSTEGAARCCGTR